MSVKPHDVAPLPRAKVKTEMRLWSRTALFTTPTLWKQELFYSKVSPQSPPQREAAEPHRVASETQNQTEICLDPTANASQYTNIG